jgi:alpha-galactosidase
VSPYDEVNFVCAGINHQAFFLEFRRGKEDVYPLLWEAIERPEVIAEEPVRTDLMKYFGYFVTESSGHASEYVPYFRKTAAMVNEELAPRFTDPVNHWFDLVAPAAICATACTGWSNSRATTTRSWAGAFPTTRSHEYGSQHHRGDGDEQARRDRRQRAQHEADHQPAGRLLRGSALPGQRQRHPADLDRRPAAAVGRAQPHQHQRAEPDRRGRAHGDTDAVYHAVMLDPLTAAVCTLPQIHSMVTEMLDAQEQWLPQF